MLSIDNNTKTRTWRELVTELTDTLIANPHIADEPAAFSTDSAEALDVRNSAEATIYYVRGFTEASDGDLVMTRGI